MKKLRRSAAPFLPVESRKISSGRFRPMRRPATPRGSRVYEQRFERVVAMQAPDRIGDHRSQIDDLQVRG
jgi:hypothetical protein